MRNEAGEAAELALAAADLIHPRWSAPRAVGALMSTRAGGVSHGPWASLNLGRAVGDDAQAVAENRRRFSAALRGRAPADGVPHREAGRGAAAAPAPQVRQAARPVWLKQVHGTQVLALDAHTPEHPEAVADAAWTATPGVACIVGAADCLPVLFAACDGRAVAAAHAGWRGLAAGVLEATVAALGTGAGVAPHELIAWLGPCIGPRHFEVGADVLLAFGHEPPPHQGAQNLPHFRFTPRPDGAPRWRADLQGLARQRLARLGVVQVTAEAACTYEEHSRFFSHRRSGSTGRMAAAIWIEPGGGWLG